MKDSENWVIEASTKNRSRHGKRKFVGYIRGYVLGVIFVFFREYERFPNSCEIRDVVGYSQSNKALGAMRELEDEGYLRLDETRCKILELLRFPYIVPRPEFMKEKIDGYSRHLQSRATSPRSEVVDIQGSAGA